MPKSPSVASYVAFVALPGEPVRRVELGAAAAIDAAVASWRDEIKRDASGKAAATLRKLIWERLEAVLPKGTTTIYLSPDGTLSAIPWPALPAAEPDRVLLEDYAFALVPYGQFLLSQLADDPPPAEASNRVLAVGNVDFGAAGEAKARWPELPATKQELAEVVALAGERPVVTVARRQAHTARVLAELPRARFAHFATHGFFADKKFRSALQLDEQSFGRPALLKHQQRSQAGSRNPLVLSGLVLAGANRAGAANDGEPGKNPTILSGESLAALPLQGLQLAVLSACDTGLGDVGGGEGVIGLQRALHGAGTQNVVASLWKVDDQATAALMKVFYHKLWNERRGPLEALRAAQLTLYRHPELIGPISRARGLRLVERVREAQDVARGQTAPVRLWAAFVLSGAGR